MFGTAAIFFATVKNPAGSRSDPIEVGQGRFDPNLLFDDGGTVYYTRRVPNDHENIVQATISIRTGKTDVADAQNLEGYDDGRR